MRHILMLPVTLFAVPCFASELGQPLDCTDWVFLEAGLHRTVVAGLDTIDQESLIASRGANLAVDANGNSYLLRLYFAFSGSNVEMDAGVLQVVRVAGAIETIVAYISDRGAFEHLDHIRPVGVYCAGANSCGGYDAELRVPLALSFDQARGRLTFAVRDYFTESELHGANQS